MKKITLDTKIGEAKELLKQGSQIDSILARIMLERMGLVDRKSSGNGAS